MPALPAHEAPFVVRDLYHAGIMAHDHVLCIGNFDGVHRGHQFLLNHARLIAEAKGLDVGILTFEPHPRLLFAPDSPHFRLTSPQQKITLLGQYGTDFIIAQHFDRAFAGLSAEAFLDLLFHPEHRIRHIIVGHDFCFGHKRQGNVDLLVARAQQHGCVVELQELLSHEGVISSSRIRQSLEQGQPQQAASLLGRPWSLCGQVQQGRQLARTLGIPTANMRLGPYQCPAKGVYAVRVGIGQNPVHFRPGIANIGQRPTVDGQDLLLEAHIFDAHLDLYGRWIEVQLLHFLRPEQKFDSIDLLRAQMMQDCADVRAFFNKEST